MTPRHLALLLASAGAVALLAGAMQLAVPWLLIRLSDLPQVVKTAL